MRYIFSRKQYLCPKYKRYLKSKFEKYDEVCKLANRNLLKCKIRVSYSISECNLI